MNPAQAQAEAMLRQMASTRALPEPAERAAARRARVILSLSDLQGKLIERRNRVRQWRRRVAWLAAAAMPALAVGGGWYLHTRGEQAARAVPAAPTGLRVEVAQGTVQVTHGGRLDTIMAPGSLGLDSCEELATRADGRAAIVLASGARLEVLPRTQLGVTAASDAQSKGDRIELTSGRVDVTVPKLPPGRALSVHTPDTTVEVRGTRFSVAVGTLQATPVTRVTVTEGRVLVRHGAVQLYLLAGSSWSSRSAGPGSKQEARAAGDSDSYLGPLTAELEAAAPELAAAPVEPVAPGDAEQGEEEADATAALRGSPPAPAKGTAAASNLAEQNWLFQQAMQARRAGHDARALLLLDQLLSRYPSTLLAQEARVERFRALARVGQQAEAAREARRYLAEHPGGFATGEARSLALDSGPDRREK
jgi:hypothetical protein